MRTMKNIDTIFEKEKTLKEMAKERTFSRTLCKYNPGGMGGPIMGEFPRITSKKMKAAVWGGADNITLSLLKTDVIDRRYIDRDHFTMDDLIEAAYSETNKDLNDMPMAGMTRPPFAALHKDGGRFNHALWSEVYSFPCQKPVGQIIVKSKELENADAPVAIQHMKNGRTTILTEKDGKKLQTDIVMSMEKSLIAIEVSSENLKDPVLLRLYRNQDQGHRRYMDENGEYLKVVQYQPADTSKPLEYYDFEADKDKNQLFDPPVSGIDGRFFWIEQKFPGEKTFPDGFRYVMMGLVSGPDVPLSEHVLSKNLGSLPYIPRDNQGYLMVPNIRTMVHPEMYELMAVNYSYVAGAPGVAVDAELGNGNNKTHVFLTVVTLNEFEKYKEQAKKNLLEAEKQGFDALASENEKWYDALYEKREQGRILMGKDPEEKKEIANIFFDEVYQSWTSGHMGFCEPHPSNYEGSASYACYDVDTQSWHSLPCYNELFTEGKFFMRNQYEPKKQWPELISHWHETLKEKARIKFGLPGMCITHGYLPAAAQSPWYMENNCLDFTMEVPAQIMKVIWNFWDYAGDETYLRETAYPLLRDLAIFYEAFARRGWDGKQFNLEPTVETESYGVSYQLKYTRNNTGALTMFRWTLKTAAEAAAYLGLDADLIDGWKHVAGNLAPYHHFLVEQGEIMGANEMAFPRFTRGDHFMYSGYYPVNLADEINLDSPEELKELMVRTADVIGYGRNFDPYILTGASKDKIPCRYAYGAEKITNHTMLAQHLVDSPERLMNSRSGRIHLFPSVPDWTVCAFRGFLARGAFEVSAARDETGTTYAAVTARRDAVCHFMSPWPGQTVKVKNICDNKDIPVKIDKENGECLVFEANKNAVYEIYLQK